MSELPHGELRTTRSGVAAAIAKLKANITVLVLCLIIALVIGALAIIFAPDIYLQSYTATATLGPPDLNNVSTAMEQQGVGLGGGAKLLSGLLNGGAQDPDFAEYEDILSSNRIAAQLYKRHPEIMPMIFYDDYDWTNHRWVQHSGPFHDAIVFLKELFNRPVESHPGVDDLNLFLQEELSVSTSVASSYATVSFSFENRQEALIILRDILDTTDQLIREERIRSTDQRMAYLRKYIADPALPADMRASLIDAYTHQIELRAGVETDDLFASMVVDPPYAALKPTVPNIPLTLVLALIGALATWTLVVLRLPKFAKWLQESFRWRQRQVIRPLEPAPASRFAPSHD